jgi:hypothetical protein
VGIVVAIAGVVYGTVLGHRRAIAAPLPPPA